MDSKYDKSDKILKDKAKRLAVAVHLVTDFMDQKEPIRYKIRDKSLVLIGQADSYQTPDVLKTIDQIMSYIEVALTARILSEMNLNFLKREYSSLGETLIQQQIEQKTASEGLTLTNTTNSNNQNPKLPSTTTTNPRRAQIISLIKQKGGWSSIKDIAQAVPNFSSKTVQRELAELVRTRILKKAGDRRWSRYMIDS